ncbi:MAG TPA: ECF transporter S component [Methanothrix sp.]|jgi:energy-coupling factor transport system substrate-specific component|uniref:ECF transporter S component n=1 Tax=Methanothrix sp. TaxID=90426 RepID=UPI001BD2CC37|nr:ECF transporter S component [Euryarchaeota archaeon]HON36212.1 ECF transporter S component [Methanothrix sp.]HPU95931.1 ECF transporter S component [Bacillota bacterium]HRT16479.1 ECF transporter S component [Methanothrix sp.]
MWIKLKSGVWFIALMAVLFFACIYGLMHSESPLGFLGNWLLMLALVVVGIIGAFIVEYENGNLSSKEVSVVAALGALSALSRIPFATFLSFQPCTFFVIISGYVFGPVCGFMVGALTALLSNMFLGQGPWTPFQMISWGLIGASSSLLGRYKVGMLYLMIWGLFWGFLYGWLMNIWFFVGYVYPWTITTFIVTNINSFFWDLSHGIANIFFLSMFGQEAITILERYKKRFRIDFARPAESLS